MSLLQKDEMLSSSIDVRATALEVYAVVSDITRIPEWSPETMRAEWLDNNQFRAWNRRRLGRWKTVSNVVHAEPGRRFSFVVQAMGADWAQWSFDLEPAAASGVTRLTETFRMCVPLPWGAVVFERLFLFINDRRTDLQHNIDLSVQRIREIVESGQTQ